MKDKEIRREVFKTPNFEKMDYTEVLPLIEKFENLKRGLNQVDNETNTKICANNIKGTSICQYEENCKELVYINPKTGKEHPICRKNYKNYLEKIKIKDGAKLNEVKLN